MVICGQYICDFAKLREELEHLYEQQHDIIIAQTDGFRSVLDAVALIRRLRRHRLKEDNESITRDYSTARTRNALIPGFTAMVLVDCDRSARWICP